MSEISPVFEETYQGYLVQIAKLDLPSMADRLGGQVTAGGITIPLFGRPFSISAGGITGPSGKTPPLHLIVILCKYLLMCPEGEPVEKNWASFKDFKDAAPLVGTFANTAERPIAEVFAGRVHALQNALSSLGGRVAGDDYPYDLSMQLRALPKIEMLLLFNDTDEEFPAECKLLFEQRTEKHLDMESVAMLGMYIGDKLMRLSKEF
jgi:hypothetical protein